MDAKSEALARVLLKEGFRFTRRDEPLRMVNENYTGMRGPLYADLPRLFFFVPTGSESWMPQHEVETIPLVRRIRHLVAAEGCRKLEDFK